VSIKPLPPEAVETFSILLHPKRTFVTSSLGATGSLKIFANPSAREKDTFRPSAFLDSKQSSETLDSALRGLQLAVHGGARNVSGALQSYMTLVNRTPTSAKNSVDLEIDRFTPTTAFTANTGKKLYVQDRAMPYYRAHRPTNHWAYVNYHSVNFFTCSNVPKDAAWLYPNVRGGAYPSGCYSPTGSFTFEFYINPRYTTEKPGAQFNVGTILHLSSSYALSLVSGSSQGADGNVNGFRMLLQLSGTANVKPSLAAAAAGTATAPAAFLSDDNSLQLNKWHHVLVTWGTSRNDQGTGSFYVDGVQKGVFVFPSASILSRLATNDALVLGNFYEGPNTGTSAQARFFAADTATREGVYQLVGNNGVNYPASFSFNHQLNAELHDVSIRDEYLTSPKATALGSLDVKKAPPSADHYLFYLPPFFVPGAPILTEVNGSGGLLTSPFNSLDEASKHPFSAPMSFDVAGRYNSLENFTKDFATNRFARVLHLTASQILTSTPDAYTANDYLYATASVRLRNLNTLPCDDGAFRPNFELAAAYDLPDDPRFVDDIGAPDHSLISLRNMVTGSIYSTMFTGSAGRGQGIAEQPREVPAGLLAVYQRTQDATSNEVVMFDISNLFFGERIRPGSLVITDHSLSGSAGRVSIRLQDDGNGGLFRADGATQRATWNHVGNVFYEEGIVLVKSPALPFFGANGYDIEFDGEKAVHTSKLNVLVDATSYNTSSNTSWSPTMSASFDVNRDPENQKFVTISGVSFHDANLNVVMRAQLAQPIVKRKGDRYLLRIKYDW
jgi:hypothetical protein